MDSGRSNFSQKCSLLSQYLKNKGSFGDLTLAFNPKIESSKQMTIFYSGKVIVFNDVPEEKAHEIIASAAAANRLTSSDLPIARKNSLARFLEKRKDRITGAAPYRTTKPAAKAVKEEEWLELGSQLPLHQR